MLARVVGACVCDLDAKEAVTPLPLNALHCITQCVTSVGRALQATQAAPLPLLLCIAQFVTSAGLAGTVSVMQGHGLPIMPRSLWTTVGMLSAVWTAGFVLFNASAAVGSVQP
jgi:hypothetical protein